MSLGLEETAIKLALQKEWDKAIALNKKVLQNNSKNKKALLRLGKAYMQKEEYLEAKRAFKKVLEIDSINKIALKNLKKIDQRSPARV
ncbi:tetratricopeptide repeat protein [candidate division WWE3 bacterium]|nr:tetratricopeptide repeat protein [candidate division WWE3 bacterium]